MFGVIRCIETTLTLDPERIARMAGSVRPACSRSRSTAILDHAIAWGCLSSSWHAEDRSQRRRTASLPSSPPSAVFALASDHDLRRQRISAFRCRASGLLAKPSNDQCKALVQQRPVERHLHQERGDADRGLHQNQMEKHRRAARMASCRAASGAWRSPARASAGVRRRPLPCARTARVFGVLEKVAPDWARGCSRSLGITAPSISGQVL